MLIAILRIRQIFHSVIHFSFSLSLVSFAHLKKKCRKYLIQLLIFHSYFFFANLDIKKQNFFLLICIFVDLKIRKNCSFILFSSFIFFDDSKIRKKNLLFHSLVSFTGLINKKQKRSIFSSLINPFDLFSFISFFFSSFFLL